MKKTKMLMISTFLLVLLMISLSSAIIQYYQEDIFLSDNHTTRSVIGVGWAYGEYDGISDVINSDELLEQYIKYSMYPQTWNARNEDYKVNNCTLTITYLEQTGNTSQTIYQETITEDDSDVYDKKYFLRVGARDSYTAFLDCYFENTENRIIDTPTEFLLVSPSWECKACQYYEWSVLQRDVTKAQIIGSNTSEVISYIKEIVFFNFEIILGIFWILIISLGLALFGLIFVGFYWMLLFLRKLAREI